MSVSIEQAFSHCPFYLVPVESTGKPLPGCHPGQYLAVLGHKQVRQYSLSDSPNGKYFCISVKREDCIPIPISADPNVPAHPGWMSNLLHKELHEGDHIDVASPYDDFSFTYATVARNEDVYAFGSYWRDIAKKRNNIIYKVFYSSPGTGAMLGKNDDHKGRMDLQDETTQY
ncbi:hypothetical protein L204_104456 [Cryptococcus depauperatus]